MMNKTKILTIRFENEIRREEIACFRGAIINAMENADVLFHNHTDDDSLRYAYPLIQYKRINQKAAIVCLGEGTEAIGEFFAEGNFDVSIGERDMTLKVDSVDAKQFLIQLWDDYFTYQIRKWLPLNKENYERYVNMEGLAEKYAFLEQLLTGNILSFAKGIGIHFENKVECKLIEVSEPMAVYHKGVKFMGFDAKFKTNVSLPDYIGLGKGVSLGKGMLKVMSKI